MASCLTLPGLSLLRWRLKAEEATEKLYAEQLAFIDQSRMRLPGLVEGRNLNPLPTKTPKPKKKAKRVGAAASARAGQHQQAQPQEQLDASARSSVTNDDDGPLTMEQLLQAPNRSRSPMGACAAKATASGAPGRPMRARAAAAAGALGATSSAAGSMRSTRAAARQTGRQAAPLTVCATAPVASSGRQATSAAAGRIVAESSKKRMRSPVAASPFTRGVVGTAEAEKKKQRTAACAPYRAPASMTPAAAAVSRQFHTPLAAPQFVGAGLRAASAVASTTATASASDAFSSPKKNAMTVATSYMTEDASMLDVNNVSLMSVDDGCVGVGAGLGVGRTPVTTSGHSTAASSSASSNRFAGGAASTSKATGAKSRARVPHDATGAPAPPGSASRASEDAAEERQRRRLLEEKERADEERIRKRKERAEELRNQKAKEKEERRRKVLDNAQRRQQEAQAKSAQKLLTTELTGRVAQTLQAEAKRKEEAERKRKAEEKQKADEDVRKAEAERLKLKMEYKQEELLKAEEEGRREEEERRREEEEREREAEEREREAEARRREEEERRREQEKRFREEEEKQRVAEETRKEEEIRRKAEEERKRRAAEAAEAARLLSAEEAERKLKAAEEAERIRKVEAAAEAERKRKQAEQAAATAAWKQQSAALKGSQPYVPTTAYGKQLIPPRQSPQTYPLDSLNSDADTDNEDAPRHALPSWVHRNRMHKFFAKQQLRGPHWWCVFKPVESLDLAATMKQVFPNTTEKAPRSSSAVWNTPPGATLRRIVGSQLQ